MTRPVAVEIQPTSLAASANGEFEKSFFLRACLFLTIAPIVFFPVYYSMTGARPQTLNQILSFLLILSSMHVALTLYFYLDKEYQGYIKDHKAFYIYFPVAVILSCGLFTLAFGKTGVVYLTIFYHAWLLFHYGRQNFGLMAFVCLSQGALPLGKVEKWAFQLAPIGAILGAHAVLPEFKEALGAYAWLSWNAGVGIYGTALGLLAYASVFSRHRDGWLPRLFFVVLALFWLPTFLFDSYKTAIMGYAVAHALQYFVFMYFSASGNRDGARRGLLLLGMGAVFGWIILWLSREKELWGPLLYFMLGAELGLVMWHFIVSASLPPPGIP